MLFKLLSQLVDLLVLFICLQAKVFLLLFIILEEIDLFFFHLLAIATFSIGFPAKYLLLLIGQLTFNLQLELLSEQVVILIV